MDVRQETASLVKSIIDELIHDSVHLLTLNTSGATGETTGTFRAGQLVYNYRIQGNNVTYSPVSDNSAGRADAKRGTASKTVPRGHPGFRRIETRMARLDGATAAMAAIDPITAPLTAVLAASLPGAAVLSWDRQHAPQGQSLTGRVAAAGLVYQFRVDGEAVRFRPAWDVETDATWAARSEGFLAARGHRLDFRDTRAKGKSASKRRCTTGYGCGATCISVNKECVIRAASAIGKERLRRLQELVSQGDPNAGKVQAAVQAGRNQKAKGLQEGRQVERLRAMLQDPAVAQMVRSGKVPAATAAAPGPGLGGPGQGGLAGTVAVVAPDSIEVDPKRFQFKLHSSASGEVGSLAGIKKWDDNLAGVISVWQDPADGKTYVVNGHNRLALAKRMAAESVTIRYLKAANANEARAIGAMQNIAQGQGSSVDAAKFFRDSGITDQAAVERAGLPLQSGKAAQGLGLARLPESMFRAVIDNELSISRGAIIGNSGLSKAKQGEIGKLLRQRKNISDGTLQEYVENLAVSVASTQGALDIFGGQETVDNGLARAELANNLRRKLAREKSLFATVSKSRATEALQQKAGNKINQRESAEVAAEADQVLRVFKELKDKAGPIATALNSAANRMLKGDPAAQVKKELEEQVIAAMQLELERAGLRKPKNLANEAPTASMFDSLISRIIRLDARARTTPGQLPLMAGGAQLDLGMQRGTTTSQGGRKPPAVGRAAKAAATGNSKAGKPCGDGHISAALTCHKGGAGAGNGAMVYAGESDDGSRFVDAKPNAAPLFKIPPRQETPASPTASKTPLADAMRQAIQQMKAADVRQMSMLANQLFESEWSLERKGKWKGMTKAAAQQAYIQEFGQQLQEAQAQRQQQAQQTQPAGSGAPMKLSQRMRQLTEAMKASDERMAKLGEKIFELRRRTMGLDSPPDEGLTGPASRTLPRGK